MVLKVINEGKVRVGNKPLSDYLISAALLFNQGVNKVVLVGRGNNISKAVALYNTLKDRMGEAIKLRDVRIGSEEIKGKVVSYIEIEVERIY